MAGAIGGGAAPSAVAAPAPAAVAPSHGAVGLGSPWQGNGGGAPGVGGGAGPSGAVRLPPGVVCIPMSDDSDGSGRERARKPKSKKVGVASTSSVVCPPPLPVLCAHLHFQCCVSSSNCNGWRWSRASWAGTKRRCDGHHTHIHKQAQKEPRRIHAHAFARREQSRPRRQAANRAARRSAKNCSMGWWTLRARALVASARAAPA